MLIYFEILTNKYFQTSSYVGQPVRRGDIETKQKQV